jgi:hypothetical protein
MTLLLTTLMLIGLSLSGYKWVAFIGGFIQIFLVMSLEFPLLNDWQYALLLVCVSFGSIFCMTHGIRSKSLDAR